MSDTNDHTSDYVEKNSKKSWFRFHLIDLLIAILLMSIMWGVTSDTFLDYDANKPANSLGSRDGDALDSHFTVLGFPEHCVAIIKYGNEQRVEILWLPLLFDVAIQIIIIITTISCGHFLIWSLDANNYKDMKI
jgi:hypothetical protein